jgi:hypothetical protein
MRTIGAVHAVGVAPVQLLGVTLSLPPLPPGVAPPVLIMLPLIPPAAELPPLAGEPAVVAGMPVPP